MAKYTKEDIIRLVEEEDVKFRFYVNSWGSKKE